MIRYKALPQTRFALATLAIVLTFLAAVLGYPSTSETNDRIKIETRTIRLSQGLQVPQDAFYIPVTLNASTQARLAVDTGDRYSSLFYEAAQKRQLTVLPSAPFQLRMGSDSRTVIGKTTITDLKIGTKSFGQTVLEVHDGYRNAASQTEGGVERVNGLHQDLCDGSLATDLLNTVDWCLDKPAKTFEILPAGTLGPATLADRRLSPAAVSVGKDDSLRVTMSGLQRIWTVVIDTGADYVLYEDAIRRNGLANLIVETTTGRFLVFEELRVGDVTSESKAIRVIDRIGSVDEDGLVGGNFFENFAVCVSARNTLLGIRRVSNLPSVDDLNYFVQTYWTKGKQYNNGGDARRAIPMFVKANAMLKPYKDRGGGKNYLEGLLKLAMAYVNAAEDEKARAVIAEIKSIDATFRSKDILGLEEALRQ